ncbi:RING-type E3 ubiquitin transferase [Malassezia caprae]|uniref:E3 ubiquitin protein ligase n=1 Tax=Malassezia caprae TaxID=1381934 RepID=A0AAF0E466_9BASI|nr:RING-type E3 ubiquitin transferase [Malassezia caprae]
MERKRELVDAGDAAAKRVHLGVDLGDEEDANPEYQRLERFRKEAIYRGLREAKREAARARQDLQSLENRVRGMQESVLAVGRFWDQVTYQCSMLPVDEPALQAELAAARAQPLSIAPGAGTPAPTDVLAARSALLERVLAHLAKHSTAAVASANDASQLQERCAGLAGEVSSLQHALQQAQAQWQTSQERVERLQELLRTAERRVDRLQSGSVREVEDPQGVHAAAAAQAPPAPAPEQAASEAAPKAESPAVDDSAARADAAASELAAARDELTTLRELAHTRERALADVRQELLEARQGAAALQQQLQSLPTDRVQSHPAYHAVQAEMVFLQQEATRLREAAAAAERENAEMREFRLEFQHQTTTQANTHSDELQKQIRLRDADIVRLRGQRDDLNAELLERRARESVKFTQVDEAKALMAQKEEQVAALQSQATRLKTELAALQGDAATVQASGAAPAPEGDAASLRLQLQAASASSAALCDEVDRLSAAYEEVEKQAESRMAGLAKLEDKVLRLTTEKSKADSKYFAAMRAKDALEAEKRALARSAERQTKVIERYMDTEKGLQAQLVQAEKEVSAYRRSVQTHVSKLAEADRDVSVLRRRLSEAERARASAEAGVAQHLATASDEAAARQRAEETISSLDREVAKLRRRVAESAAAGPRRKGSESETHLEYLNALLRCSACKERYRDRIITRCLHTFCEACVNARIQTRQRKCPHCGLAFATSDVQVLYLQ